ncbi:beta-defensin 130B-like [Camelus dromedarius]|uniref:Beta-defensin 130B-like n=3 Tax=Camelidae TaxID=9835 RepID=A0A8B8S365_CAMFR|nr:beta-defensin 130-like [Camelus dromedarius]XP_031547181.1 beta-defensin 130-like [Vicugna pacos]XP_032324656.1 beta-defensin 130B-like [Camelus ferus]XP_045371359.1 beta-defensin 130B-like [Camelus bactrianus]
MRLRSLLSVLLLSFIIIPEARTGLIPGEKQCLFLRGFCSDGGCDTTEDTLGICNDEKKCCRKWWTFFPYPTPVPKSKSP